MKFTWGILLLLFSTQAIALSNVASAKLNPQRGPIKVGDAIKISCSLGLTNTKNESKFLENAFSEAIVLQPPGVLSNPRRFDAKSIGVTFDGQVILYFTFFPDPAGEELSIIKSTLVYRPNPDDQDENSTAERMEYGSRLPNELVNLSLSMDRKEKRGSVITWVNCKFE